MVILGTSFSSWIRHLLACIGGCFGCCSKPTPITAVDEPSKGLKIQGRAVKKGSLSDDFWSTSTCDLEYSAVQSQRSISSTSVPNLNPTCAVSSSTPCDFVNHGLLLWQQTRLQWTTTPTTTSRNQTRRWEPRFGWGVTYEGLLGSRNPFPRPIPLSEMVDFLADVWEQEGLYD